MKRTWWERTEYMRSRIFSPEGYKYRNTGRWHWFKHTAPVWLVRETVYHFRLRTGRLVRNLLGDFCPDLEYKVMNFAYDGFGGQLKGGYAPYTSRFKQWTEDPGIELHICSDGKERRIPGWALEPICMPKRISFFNRLGLYVPVQYKEQVLGRCIGYHGPKSSS